MLRESQRGGSKLCVLPSPQQVRLPQPRNCRGQPHIYSPDLHTGLLSLATVAQLGSRRSSRDPLATTSLSNEVKRICWEHSPYFPAMLTPQMTPDLHGFGFGF